MDPSHKIPYQNWYDWPRSGHSDQMYGIQGYMSNREPSRQNYSNNAFYDLRIGNPSPNAAAYQDANPGQDEVNTNDEDNIYV